MSYKYMLSAMLASKAKMGIICEDDVIFPLDYDQKLNKIIDHLQTTEVDGIFCRYHRASSLTIPESLTSERSAVSNMSILIK
ncbi:hypothetical protein DMH17_16795 [Raoultella planticola]|nr:hypothetical protein [Raoultella planticola]